jgi:hypothetical protein
VIAASVAVATNDEVQRWAIGVVDEHGDRWFAWFLAVSGMCFAAWLLWSLLREALHGRGWRYRRFFWCITLGLAGFGFAIVYFTPQMGPEEWAQFPEWAVLAPSEPLLWAEMFGVFGWLMYMGSWADRQRRRDGLAGLSD